MPAENEGIEFDLDLGEPPKELLEWAKEEFGEDPDTRCQKLSDFRDMIYERGECVPHRTDDAFLLRFLRARYFVIERAHRLFVNYYDFKEDNPEIFDGVRLRDLKKIGKHDVISVPPYREQTGRRILLYKFGNWDPEKITVVELFQATLSILELAILEQRAQILGGIAMFDFSGLTVQQALHMTPSVAKKIIQIMVTSFYMKIKAIHIVNQSWIFDTIYNLFKPFLDDRMKQRLFFHGENMESLHQHIDPKCLPKRYGGVHDDYDYNNWIKSFKANATILKELNSLGYDTRDDRDEETDDDNVSEGEEA